MMTRRQAFFYLTLAVLILMLASAAMADPIGLSNNYVKTAVSDYGTLGSDGSTSPGLLYDPSGNSNYGNNDILTPGDPFEGFYVNYNGTSAGSNNDGSSANFGISSPTVTQTGAVWTGTNGALTITNSYSLNGQVINIDTTLTAQTNLSNVEFLRTLDPDPDVNLYGIYSTTNVRVSNDEVVASGQYSTQTVGLYSNSDIAHNTGVSGWWSTNPSDFLGGVNDGNGDYTIGMAFNVGNMAQGTSVDLNYEYFVGATPNANSPIAVPTTTTPESSSLALLGAGLLGLMAVNRKKLAS